MAPNTIYTSIVSLLQHYFEYLRSPAVLLSIFVVVGPILLEAFKNYKLAPVSKPLKISGCFRLGISKKSNLDDQYDQLSANSGGAEHPRVKALFTYPVKSCRGVELAASEVGPTGLKYDRLFTFARQLPRKHKASDNDQDDDDSGQISGEALEWRFITQREFPRLALIETEMWLPKPHAGKRAVGKQDEKTAENIHLANGGCLVLRFPFQPSFNLFPSRDQIAPIYLPLAPTLQHMKDRQYALEPLSIWTDTVQAINITHEIPPTDLDKLRDFLHLKSPLGLFRVDHSNQRPVVRSLPKDRPDDSYAVGFADAFPSHLLNMASVKAQDAELPKDSSLRGRLDARRFRANIYVTGPPAYDEDTWKKVTIGRCLKSNGKGALNGQPNADRAKGGKVVEIDAEYHIACRTARCKLPNVDQDSGIRDRNEPSTTLGRTRKVDPGAYPHPCLGVQMIPLFQQGLLRVGDEIRVLERGEHVYEKMFP